MKTSSFGWFLVAIALAISGGVIPAWAEDGPVVEDILQVLREREIIDDDEYQRMASKNAKYEAERNSWVPEIDWSGDFRFCHESWWYEKDETGGERSDRYRIRYRFRVKGVIGINDYTDVIFRLVSGPFELRGRIEETGSWTDFGTLELGLLHFEAAGPQQVTIEPVRLEGPALMSLSQVMLRRVDAGGRPVRGRKVLLIGIDGLRPDIGQRRERQRVDRGMGLRRPRWSDRAHRRLGRRDGPPRRLVRLGGRRQRVGGDSLERARRLRRPPPGGILAGVQAHHADRRQRALRRHATHPLPP